MAVLVQKAMSQTGLNGCNAGAESRAAGIRKSGIVQKQRLTFFCALPEAIFGKCDATASGKLPSRAQM